jgi:tetratricopeptide (TPR) repeat protein
MIAALRIRLRNDPGLVLLFVALALALAVYAPTLGRGLVNYDDPWLVGDNFVLRRGSWSTLHTIFFDTRSTTRFLLGAEYLPIRDISVLADFAIWGDWYPGHHLTNLFLYLAAIAIWFAVLDGWGIDRKLVGLAILLWALHPTHAESVAWLSERKGLLGALFAGVAGLGYVRFRAGRRVAWLAVAVLATVLAVWSKALSAFAIASFLGLELALPARRTSWKRSLVGLGALAVVGGAAFLPVLATAKQLSVVASASQAPAGWLASVLGGHGFYVEQAVLAFPNAVSYPIRTHGPSAVQIVLGAVTLLAALALVAIPARGRWRPPPAIRGGAWIWLFVWFPASRAVLPLKSILFADRYALLSTLGAALIAAALLSMIAAGRARTALIATLVVASTLRTLDAQSNWRSSVTLWQRATVSNPADGDAWASYSEALESAGQDELAIDMVARGLRRSRSPRLLLRKALLVLAHGQRDQAISTMQQAAEAGEPRAMSNLSLLLLEEKRADEALAWGRRAAATAPMYGKAYRNLGVAALAVKRPQEAYEAFTRAYDLAPFDRTNRYNLALSLIELRRHDEARAHLEACVDDAAIGAKARAALAQLRAE